MVITDGIHFEEQFNAAAHCALSIYIYKEVGGEVVFEVWDGGNDYVPLTPVGK